MGTRWRPPATGPSALKRADRLPPDVVVRRLRRCRRPTGCGSSGRFRMTISDCPVIFLTGQGTIDAAVAAIRRGGLRLHREAGWTRPGLKLSASTGALEKSETLREVQVAPPEAQAAGSHRVHRTVGGHSPGVRADRAGGSGQGQRWPSPASRAPARRWWPGASTTSRPAGQAFHRHQLRFHPRHPDGERAAGPRAGAPSPAPTSAGRGSSSWPTAARLFLDEVAEIPLELQAKLLRASWRRAGCAGWAAGSSWRSTSGCLSATNRDLKEEIRASRFREDLFFRLHVFQIPLPAAARTARGHPAAGAALSRQVSAASWPSG